MSTSTQWCHSKRSSTFENDAGLIAAFQRVLKPDGELLISTPNGARTDPNDLNPWHVRELTRAEFVNLLETSGFTVKAILAQRTPSERTDFVTRQVKRFVARFPHQLCRPGRWWDTIAHGSPDVEPYSAGEPFFWVVRAQRA
jgi:SAM-dependent methyltransferase